MAISIIFGPGGSGKSMFQVHVIIRELVESERNICTNLALNVPRLAAYVEERFPDRDLRVAERIRILTREEAAEFWKYRGPERWHQDNDGHWVDDGVGPDKGVAYIIDEAGSCGFSATEWAAVSGKTTKGAQCIWYLEQQRKFGDNVYASANGRAPTTIAKGFRDRAHDFTRLQNGYQRKIGMFKARGRFTRYSYLTEPNKNVEPYEISHFQLDVKGIGSCYRTQDGMGVHGTTADIGKKAKGVPIMMIFPILIGAGALCFVVPWLLGKGLGHVLGKGKTPAVDAALVKRSSSPAVNKELPATRVSSPALLEHKLEDVAGVAMQGGRVLVSTIGRGWSHVVARSGDRLKLENGAWVSEADVVRGGTTRTVTKAKDEPKP